MTLNTVIVETFYKDFGRPEDAKGWAVKEYNAWINKLGRITDLLAVNNYIGAIQELSTQEMVH